MGDIKKEISELIQRWNTAIINLDLETCRLLRDSEYTAVLPSGVILAKTEEIKLLSEIAKDVHSIEIKDLSIRLHDDVAIASYNATGRQGVNSYSYSITIVFMKKQDSWTAISSHTHLTGEPETDTNQQISVERKQDFNSNHNAKVDIGLAHRIKNLIPVEVKSLAKKGIKRITSKSKLSSYFPYIQNKQGSRYFFIPNSPDSNLDKDNGLPVPPKELWLGYADYISKYLASGEKDVSKMLSIVKETGFEFKQGDRILDLGCGAGRMIRHLKHLSDTCEIWGMDISAEHIYWCKQYLSPPFHFATSTKIPHLPFEDRSVDFIYCGSLFTHIDDLAELWLLELHRILSADGRLYITIHDNHTVELMDTEYNEHGLVKWIKSHEEFDKARNNLGMLTINRDNDSMVFYGIDYFKKTLGSLFEIISVTQEAYLFQTAIVVKRKPKNV